MATRRGGSVYTSYIHVFASILRICPPTIPRQQPLRKGWHLNSFQLRLHIIKPPIPTAIKPAAAHLPVAVGAAPVATMAVSPEATPVVEPVVLEVSVGVELGVGVVETLSGSVPVAMIAVSPEAL